MTPRGNTVGIPRVLAKVLPRYLESKQKDMREIREALARGDFEPIRIQAHNWKGSGAGYGIPRISAAGRQVEAAARAQDAAGILEELTQLEEYLRDLQVVYE